MARFRETYAQTSRKNVFTEPRQDHFSNWAIKLLGPPRFLYLEKRDISGQSQQKQPSQTPVAASLRDMYVPNPRKHVCTEPKIRPFP